MYIGQAKIYHPQCIKTIKYSGGNRLLKLQHFVNPRLTSLIDTSHTSGFEGGQGW